MKYLAHFPTNRRTSRGKWVYLQAQSDQEVEATTGGSGIDMVDFGIDFEVTNMPLNPAVTGAASHVRVETAETLKNQTGMLGGKASELMLRSQRSGGAFTLQGVFNMHSPTGQWFMLDRAGWDTVNPVKWLVGTLNSKGPIVAAFKQNLDNIIKINEDSPLIGTTLTHAFLKHNLGNTLDRVSGSKNEGFSLHSMEVLEESVRQFFPKSEADFDRFEESLVDRLRSEELLKKGFRIMTGFYEQRIRLQASKLRNQFESGYEQFLENIEAAKELQGRKVGNISAKIGAFMGGVSERGDMDNAEAYWWMVTEIIQNPDDFLSDPKDTYFGIDWRKEFGCAKGKIGAVDFLDTLHVDEQTVNVVDMPAIQMAHQNNMQMMDNVRERDKNLKLSMNGFSFEVLRDHLHKTELDRNDEIKTTEDVVALLVEGLHRSPLNIDTEREVFKDNRSMYQSPMEKLAQLGNYILQNPALLKPNATTGLNIDILSGLKGYLYHKESSLGAQLESRSLTEVGSPWTRFTVLTSADNMMVTVQKIMDETIPALSENIRIMGEGSKVDAILNEMEKFPAAMTEFIKLVGKPSDEGNTLYSQMTESEKEVVDTIYRFETFSTVIKSHVEKMQEERAEYIEKYSVPDETFRAERRNTLDEYEDTVKDIVEKTDGGFGTVPEGMSVGDLMGSGTSISGGSGSNIPDGAGANVASGTGANFMAGVQTSLSNMQDHMSSLIKNLTDWGTLESQGEGFPFSIIDNPKDVLGPFVEMARKSVQNAKKEVGLGEGSEIEIDTDRPTLDDLMRVEMAYEANDYMGGMARKFLQSYNMQQWERLVTKPIGFKLNAMHWGDLTHQTKFNPLATILNPAKPLQNIRMIPTPAGEAHPESVIYLENDDYFMKVIPPHINADGDQSNLFLYQKGDKDETLNPFSAQPVAKGVVMSSEVENKTLRNNTHYKKLFQQAT